MSKKLYYSSCSIAAPHIGVIIDDLLAAKQGGDEVYWAYCHCALSSCFMNLDAHNCICKFCHRMYEEYKRVYGAGIHMLPINGTDIRKQKQIFDFKNAEELKGFVYRHVEVGNSILSLYYTVTRDLDMNRFEQFHDFALPLVSEICNLTDYMYQVVDQIKPDEIIVHNGRLYENRFLYDIAKVLNIPFKAVETVGGHGEPYAKMSYYGVLPQNLKNWTRLVKTTWDNSPVSLEEKVKIGSSFYERRRNGELVVDVKVYVANQKRGLLPKGFDPNKRNIAIYTSSQDEIVALGSDWNYDQLFQNQSEAIDYILKHTSGNIHYYIRIHPNLKGVNYKDHLDLYQYDKYPFVTVIPPESKVSSYDLMDACEKVVTFGSSVGMEAVYWGKPSVLIGHSGYEAMDIAYHVRKLEDVMPTVEGFLTPKDRLGAIKYGYFLLDREYKVDQTLTDIGVKIRRYRWDFIYTSYLKIKNSQTLYQLAHFWYYIVLPKFKKPEHPFPWNYNV